MGGCAPVFNNVPEVGLGVFSDCLRKQFPMSEHFVDDFRKTPWIRTVHFECELEQLLLEPVMVVRGAAGGGIIDVLEVKKTICIMCS